MFKFILVGIIILGLGWLVYVNYIKQPSQQIPQGNILKEINYQASFKIYTNGTLRDFSSEKYHNRSEDVFITSENPNIVHVRKEGITWDDFFKTLPNPMKLSKDCLVTGTGQEFCTDTKASLKFYLNGRMDINFLSKEIMDGDKVLITYGSEDESEIKIQLKSLE